MYSHVTRKNVERAYLRWRKVSYNLLILFLCIRLIFLQHRGLTWEEQSAAIDCPLYEPYPTFKMQYPLSYN